MSDDTDVACVDDSPDCDLNGRLCVDGFCIIKNNNGENSFHVTTGSGTDATAVIDGFTIMASNANGSFPHNFGGGMFNDAGSPTVTNSTLRGNSAISGGGMFNLTNSSPTVTNCVFSKNWATNGGGMFNFVNSNSTVTHCAFSNNSAGGGGGMFNSSSSPTVANCSFTRNSVSNSGGGIHNLQSSPTVTNCSFTRNSAPANFGGGMLNSLSNPTITNCTFSGNSADQGGGMAYQNSNPIVTNCTFSGNTAVNDGAGMHNSNDSDPMVTNCTFTRNLAGGDGGSFYTISAQSTPTLGNSIFWQNSDAGGMDESAQIHVTSGIPVVNYSIVQGGWSGAGGVGIVMSDPLFIDADGEDNVPGTEDDDLRLRSASPAIDAGDNSALPADLADLDGDMDTAEEIPFDLDGLVRRTDDPTTVDSGDGTAPIVDMGAYEFVLPDLIYVDASATGADDGSTWADAYVNLQDALAFASAAGGEVMQVWVAAGTYLPDQGGGETPGDRTATFQLFNGVGLYGGFAGGETLLSQRNITLNETTLSGDLSGDDTPVACTLDSPDCNTNGGLCVGGFCIIKNNNAENSYHVTTGSGTDATAILDGFTITAANADGSFPGERGAGMYNDGGSPTLANCTFSGNSADLGGGMLNLSSSNPSVTNCTFSGNSADFNGGGMSNSDSSPTVTNCTFSGNSAVFNASGMDNFSSSPTVTNCTFAGNSTTDGDGGGMRNRSSSSPTVTNCTFSGNSAAFFGGGMLNNDSSPTVTNCTFSGNSADWSGGGMWNGNSSSATVINCTFSGNSADKNGGGMANAFSDDPSVSNCTFSGNAAAVWGGGMYNDGSSPTVTNCTFSGNTSNDLGGGMLNRNSGPTVTNSVLWGNIDDADGDGGGPFMDESAQIHTITGPPVVNYSIVMGGWTGAGGTGNLATDPLFVDANGADDIPGTEDDDLRLRSASPAIDAGDNAALPADVADLDGDGDTVEPTPRDLALALRFFDDPATPDTGLPGVCVGGVFDGLGCQADPECTAGICICVTPMCAVVDMGAFELQPVDCNNNGLPDNCDLDCGQAGGSCDIPGCGTRTDCDDNGIPDECDIDVNSASPGGPFFCVVACDSDCNSNGIPDECDIADCAGDPGCDDCNLNGIPDGCEASTVCGEFIPDPACANDEWSCPENWTGDVPPDSYPDDVASAEGISVTLGSTASVLLDVPIVVPTVTLETGSVLRVTGPGGADLNFSDTSALSISGDLQIDADHTVGAMTPHPTITIGAEGRYVKDPMATLDSSAALTASTLTLIDVPCDAAPCPDGGLLELTDTMSLTVLGNMTIDGTGHGGCDSLLAGAVGGALAVTFHAPPTGSVRERARVRINDSLSLLGSAGFGVSDEATVTISGDFKNNSTSPSCFDVTSGTLIFDGTMEQSFEVADTDIGAIPDVLTAGYAIDEIILLSNKSGGATVRLVDDFDNDGNSQLSGCSEALYLRSLVLGPNTTLILDQANVYFEGLLIDQTAQIVVESGACANQAPPALLDAGEIDKSRALAFVIPTGGAGAAPIAGTALRVTLVSLYHPGKPFPVDPPDFSSREGEVRYVNFLRDDKGAAVTSCLSSPSLLTFYPCATVGCDPEYTDWAGLFGGETLYISGSSIVPDSTYRVAQLAASCTGNEATCAATSQGLELVTGRDGDVDASGTTTVTDIVLTVDVVKDVAGAVWEYQAYVRDESPQPHNASVNVTDIVLHVDALKLVAYALGVPGCP